VKVAEVEEPAGIAIAKEEGATVLNPEDLVRPIKVTFE